MQTHETSLVFQGSLSLDRLNWRIGSEMWPFQVSGMVSCTNTAQPFRNWLLNLPRVLIHLQHWIVDEQKTKGWTGSFLQVPQAPSRL